MKYRIYDKVELLNEVDIYKNNWQCWKKFNEKSKRIFFPVYKEFEESHLKELNGGACKLYILLGLKSRPTGESWYSIKKMADYFAVSTRTIDNWLQELEDRGLIYRERHGASTTTYLVPYSLNIIEIKPASDISLEEALTILLTKASNEIQIVGGIYRIFHLFQWHQGSDIKCIQAVVIITHKKYKNCEPISHAYLYCINEDSPPLSINETELTRVKRFDSPLNKPQLTVYGIALNEEHDFNQLVNQRDAIYQLYHAPLDVLNSFPKVDYI